MIKTQLALEFDDAVTAKANWKKLQLEYGESKKEWNISCYNTMLEGRFIVIFLANEDHDMTNEIVAKCPRGRDITHTVPEDAWSQLWIRRLGQIIQHPNQVREGVFEPVPFDDD